MNLCTVLNTRLTLRELLRERLASYAANYAASEPTAWELTVECLTVPADRPDRRPPADYDTEAGGDQDLQTRADRLAAELAALSPAARRRDLLDARRRFGLAAPRREVSPCRS